MFCVGDLIMLTTRECTQVQGEGGWGTGNQNKPAPQIVGDSCLFEIRRLSQRERRSPTLLAAASTSWERLAPGVSHELHESLSACPTIGHEALARIQTVPFPLLGPRSRFEPELEPHLREETPTSDLGRTRAPIRVSPSVP